MLDKLTPARRNLALLLLLAAVLWFSWTVRAALNPVLLSFLFAYMLHPLVLSLERRGWSRKRAVNVIYAATAAFVLLASVVLFVQGRELWHDLSSEEGRLAQIDERLTAAYDSSRAFIDRWLPEALQPASTEGQAGAAGSGAEPRPSGIDALLAELRAWLSSGEGLNAARQAGSVAAGGLWAVVRKLFGSLLTFLTLTFLVPVYTWFLLFELERIAEFVKGYVPVGQRERMARIAGQIAEVLGNFFRGRLLVCLLKGLILAAVLGVLGVPYGFLVGALSGFLSLIPFVGPLFGYALGFLLALLDFSVLGAAWRIVVVFSVGELIEGYVLLPRVLGDSLGMHPLVVLVSLTVAGAALGMFGLLLALPLTATVIILAREIVLPALKDWAEGRRARAAGSHTP